ncbi:MAG: hypothetical protein JWQ38_688 [Flavipsychrobacter sp.]|nr:hypothetical protein [Flavipsychrobacter sp.]
MYITRDIFQLKFAHYRDVKPLLDEASQKGMFNEHNCRVLTDFTGDAYRLILEQSFKSLAEYETMMSGDIGKDEWQQWYMKFKEHVVSSHREILKQII